MKSTNATTHRRTFCTEVAPSIYLVTDAVATIDYHDDGEPCGGGHYRQHWFEDEDGARLNNTAWPWMWHYIVEVQFNREDPHKAEFEAWIEELETAAEIENAVGPEAPPTNHSRDTRPEEEVA